MHIGFLARIFATSFSWWTGEVLSSISRLQPDLFNGAAMLATSRRERRLQPAHQLDQCSSTTD
jgi:hypothetical protein